MTDKLTVKMFLVTRVGESMPVIGTHAYFTRPEAERAATPGYVVLEVEALLSKRDLTTLLDGNRLIADAELLDS